MEGSSVLNHTAGNLFRQRGVQPGDLVYVISSERGRLRLVGRMKVAEIVDQETATRRLGTTNLWEASEHCISVPGSGTPLLKQAVLLPREQTRKLRFETDAGPQPPVMHRGALDQQTLRGVRRLTTKLGLLLTHSSRANPRTPRERNEDGIHLGPAMS